MTTTPTSAPLTVKLALQITPRMNEDLRAVMAAEGVDLSTAVRAAIRVGLTHGSEVSAMTQRDKADRTRRVRETSAKGGRRGMATRKEQAEAAQRGFVGAVRDYAESATPPVE